MYLHFTPPPIHWIFHRYTWRRKAGKPKTIYLTFDDGPLPDITPFVLQVLKQYQAKATFFCVGDNVQKFPDLLRRVVKEGHQVGNHTYHHLNGFKTTKEEYIQNTEECAKELKKVTGIRPQLFRPPYGRIRKEQATALLPHYEIIMWDVLSADYDQSLNKENCLQKSIRYTRNGSVVVFHDSPKAWTNLSWVLPRYLEHFSARGFRFASL